MISTFQSNWRDLIADQPRAARTETFKFRSRTHTASGQVLRGSAALPAAQDGQADQQADTQVHGAHVLRQEEDATGVLVQHTEEPGGRAVQVHPGLGAASLRRTQRGTRKFLVNQFCSFALGKVAVACIRN